jgi:hypothetical protein
MKTLKTVLMVALFSAATFSANAGTDPTNSDNELRAELLSLVNDININDMDQELYRVEVHFIVNAKNEIVVVSTSDKEFDQILKSKLNYQTIKTGDIALNKLFILPILFRK